MKLKTIEREPDAHSARLLGGNSERGSRIPPATFLSGDVRHEHTRTSLQQALVASVHVAGKPSVCRVLNIPRPLPSVPSVNYPYRPALNGKHMSPRLGRRGGPLRTALDGVSAPPDGPTPLADVPWSWT